MCLSKLQTILLLIVIGLILPIYVNAFLEGPIVPCGTSTTDECTFCDIFKMGQNIINFIWELIIVIVPIFILAGGIMILTAGAKPEQMGLGKKIIFNAIIGLVIAFLSWTIINMVFNTLVGEGKKEGFPWPWNEIQCKGGGVKEGEEEPIVKEGEYCVCEVPVYDLDPNQYPSQASIIGTNIKATKLADKDTCKQGCVSGNANTYCPSTLTLSKANLYCTDESSAQSKTTCAVKLSKDPQCHIGTGKCWSEAERDACPATITPEATGYFTPSYAKRCFLNGEALCDYKKWAGGNFYCPKKAAGPCTSDKPYTLYRFAEESSTNQLDALACSNQYYGNTGYVCRLNCQYDRCSITPTNRCDQMSPAGSCLGSYSCQKGVIDQIKDASAELKDFLSCMSSVIPLEAREVSSISDNSGGRCFKEWNGQCSASQDSCTGDCCGHSKCSLHYGGKARQEQLGIIGPSECGIGSTDCRMYSYAVDFAKESYFDQIKKAAQDCGEQLWDSYLEQVDVIKEGNHIHIELEGIAKYHKCK